MIKICKFCDEKIEVNNYQQMGAHVANCDMNPNKKEKNRKAVATKLKNNPINKYNFKCEKCETYYILNLTLFNFKKSNYTKYCSRNCANGHPNKLKKEKSNCFNCGTKNPLHNNLYCSTNCFFEYRWKLKIKEIESGIIINPKVLKKYLVELRGHKCEICKETTWMNKKIPLVLDHINGNATNCLPNNLRLICPNCDHQTDTFSGKNIGNPTRERYYQKFKMRR